MLVMLVISFPCRKKQARRLSPNQAVGLVRPEWLSGRRQARILCSAYDASMTQPLGERGGVSPGRTRLVLGSPSALGRTRRARGRSCPRAPGGSSGAIPCHSESSAASMRRMRTNPGGPTLRSGDEGVPVAVCLLCGGGRAARSPWPANAPWPVSPWEDRRVRTVAPAGICARAIWRRAKTWWCRWCVGRLRRAWGPGALGRPLGRTSRGMRRGPRR
jgi:hypothetical protein